MSRPINKVIHRRIEPMIAVTAMRPYIPAPIVPPRAGSMLASTLPSKVGEQQIYPRRATRAESRVRDLVDQS